MTVDEVLNSIGNATTDDSGHIGNFMFRQGGTTAHLMAELDRSGGASPALWRIVWTVHWRSTRGQEHRDSSTDLRGLLARFGRVDLLATPSGSLDDLESSD